MRQDTTTRDTRLADDPMEFNPATVTSLIELTLGGIYPGHRSGPLHCRVRYFDPVARRAGLPDDVAALVEGLTASETTLTLVNLNQSQPRQVIVQGGAYGEHQWESVRVNGKEVRIDGSRFTLKLGPGAGGRMVLKTKRYANQPTLLMPWDHG